MTDEAQSSKDKLTKAALELIAEAGFRGATTRRIAERAGVNEVTLFRLFGTKLGLFAEAFMAVTKYFREGLEHPSGNLIADLENLASRYNEFFALHRGVVLRVLPEVSHNAPLKSLIEPFIRRTSSQFFTLFEDYQRKGQLIEEDPKTLALAFLGPLAARVLIGPIIGETFNFEAKNYVKQYLEGRGK